MLTLEESEFLPRGFFTICLNGTLSRLTLREEGLRTLFTVPTASSGCPNPCGAGDWEKAFQGGKEICLKTPLTGPPFVQAAFSWRPLFRQYLLHQLFFHNGPPSALQKTHQEPVQSEDVSPLLSKFWGISSECGKPTVGPSGLGVQGGLCLSPYSLSWPIFGGSGPKCGAPVPRYWDNKPQTHLQSEGSDVLLSDNLKGCHPAVKR